MNGITRQKKIEELLSTRDNMSVEELSEALQVSLATVRRDLTSMEKEGTLTRYHGGAVLTSKSFERALRVEERLDKAREAKLSIARKAASLVSNGDIIFIDSSSTTYFMVDFITAQNVTVVTSAILIPPVTVRKKIRTYVLGGFVDENCNSVAGDEVMRAIKSMNFDKAFLGTYAIEEARGFTTYEIFEGDMKRLVIDNAQQTYMLADSSKFSAKGFIVYAPLDKATIITERQPENPTAFPSLLLAE